MLLRLVALVLIASVLAVGQHHDADEGYDGHDFYTDHSDSYHYGYDESDGPSHIESGSDFGYDGDFESDKASYTSEYNSGPSDEEHYSEYHSDSDSHEDYESEPTKKKSSSLKPGPHYNSQILAPQDEYQETVPKLVGYTNKPRKYKKYKPSETKKSSTVKANSEDEVKKYGPKYTKINPLAAYKKYSFQKPKTVEDYESKPFNPNSPYRLAESASNQESSNCRKVENLSSDGLTTCFICVDPKTKSEFQECSTGAKRSHTRRKRESKEEDEEEEYVDPYEEVKKRVATYSSEPESFKSDQYNAPDFSNYEKYADYRFGPEFFKDSEHEEKSSSEIQSDKLKKNGENCKKVKRDSMVCIVCENSKSGSNYEQCSFSNTPKEKKYAYTRERKYNSDDDERQDDAGEETIKSEKKKKKPKKSQKIRTTTEKYEEPEEYYEEDDEERGESQIVKSQKASPKAEQKEAPLHDEYFDTLFPEYSTKVLSKSKKPSINKVAKSRKEVQDVLAEFSNRDRAGCKHEQRGLMTCYICKDSKGLLHEECAFVSESEPKKTQLAYHKVKEYSNKKNNSEPDEGATGGDSSAESSSKKITPSKSDTNKTVNASVLPPLPLTKARIARRKTNLSRPQDLQISESRRSETRVQAVTEREAVGEEEESATAPITPDEFIVDGSDGAFASELQPVFSKFYGTTLPKYMTQISEYERDFDEFASFG